MSFSWIPFYRELAMRLLEYESKQGELIAFIADLKKKNRAKNGDTLNER